MPSFLCFPKDNNNITYVLLSATSDRKYLIWYSNWSKPTCRFEQSPVLGRVAGFSPTTDIPTNISNLLVDFQIEKLPALERIGLYFVLCVCSLSVTKITMYRSVIFVLIISNCMLLTVCESSSFIMKINATKRAWYKYTQQNGKLEVEIYIVQYVNFNNLYQKAYISSKLCIYKPRCDKIASNWFKSGKMHYLIQSVFDTHDENYIFLLVENILKIHVQKFVWIEKFCNTKWTSKFSDKLLCEHFKKDFLA